jgi:hypothetical protein
MQIQITQSDIDQGHRGSPFGCPVARAIRRYFPNCSVLVGGAYIFINNSSRTITDSTRKFIDAYDTEKPVSPCEVTL